MSEHRNDPGPQGEELDHGAIPDDEHVHPGNSVFPDTDSRPVPGDDLGADADPSSPGGLDEGVARDDTLEQPGVESGRGTGLLARAGARLRLRGGSRAAGPAASGDAEPAASNPDDSESATDGERRRRGGALGSFVGRLSIRGMQPRNARSTDGGNADADDQLKSRKYRDRGDMELAEHGYGSRKAEQKRINRAERMDSLKEKWNNAGERWKDRQKRGIRTKEDFTFSDEQTDSPYKVDYDGWLEASRDDLARIKSRSQFKLLSKGKVKAALENYQEALGAHTALKLIGDQQDKGEKWDDAKLDEEAKKIAIEDADLRSELEKKHFMQSNKGKFLNWFGNQSLAKKVLIAAPVGVGIAAGSGVALAAASGGVAAAGVGGLIGAAKFGRSKWRQNSRKARDAQLDKAEEFRAGAEEYHITAADNATDTSDANLSEVDRTIQRVMGVGNIVREGVEKLSRHERRQARISAGIGAVAIVGGANVDRIAGLIDDTIGETSAGEWIGDRYATATGWLGNRWDRITNLWGDNDHDGGSEAAREAAGQESVPADPNDIPETINPADEEAYREFAEAGLTEGEITDILANPEDFENFISWAETAKEQLSNDPAYEHLSEAEIEDKVLENFEKFTEGLDLDQVNVEAGHGITQEIAEVAPNLDAEQYYNIYEQLREAHGDSGIFEGVQTYVMPNGDLGVMQGQGHWAPGVRQEIERLAYETSARAAREAAEEADDLALAA